jgi:hypothetical protein
MPLLAVVLDQLVDHGVGHRRRACRLRSGTSPCRSSGRSGPARTAVGDLRIASHRASRRSGACGWPSRCRCRRGRPCGTGPSPGRISPSPCPPAAGVRLPRAGTGDAAVVLDHAVADEAVAHAGDHRHLPDLLGQLHGGGQHVLGGGGAAHHFQQLHDVGRAEEVQADHVLRPLREAAILSTSSVEVLVARIAPGLATASSFLNTCSFDAHLLEHRLDDEVGVLQVVVGPASA